MPTCDHHLYALFFLSILIRIYQQNEIVIAISQQNEIAAISKQYEIA